MDEAKDEPHARKRVDGFLLARKSAKGSVFLVANCSSGGQKQWKSRASLSGEGGNFDAADATLWEDHAGHWLGRLGSCGHLRGQI